MRIFGQTGGHALNIAADLDHDDRMNSAIYHLRMAEYEQNRAARIEYALRHAGLDEDDLTDEDIARLMQELG